jgi:hypothetical protein
MTDPRVAPMKKKDVPYNAEAIPAMFPIGSIASALLFGSMAKLRDINNAMAMKKNTIPGGSPTVSVITSSKLATTVYRMSRPRRVRRAPYFVESRELINVQKAINNPILAKIHENNSGL